DGFHDLLIGGAGPGGQPCVPLDAVRALGHVGDGHGDQLFRAAGQCSVGEDGLAERGEGGVGLRGELLPTGVDGGGGLGVERIGHGGSFCGCGGRAGPRPGRTVRLGHRGATSGLLSPWTCAAVGGPTGPDRLGAGPGCAERSATVRRDRAPPRRPLRRHRVTAIDSLWPAPGTALTDEQLLESYAPPAGPWLRMNFVSSLDGAVT